MTSGRDLGLPFFCDEPFTQFHPRIHENDRVQVFINEKRDFAKLFPTPAFDYATYIPRAQKLGTQDPKKQSQYMNLRLDVTAALMGSLSDGNSRVLEIGANDGSFMKVFRERLPRSACEGLEPSEPHRRAAREAGLTMHANIDEIRGDKFDVICMFHTFEHFVDPLAELKSFDPLLKDGGTYVIEIPSLSDPLLSLYEIDAFKDFYFQAQHPYVYSPSSLRRLLESSGYAIVAERAVQRYGLGNHLQWLRHGRPGVFGDFNRDSALEEAYKKFLVSRGQTDTLFAQFKPASR
jgi:SAM-dependent methyltransferase